MSFWIVLQISTGRIECVWEGLPPRWGLLFNSQLYTALTRWGNEFHSTLVKGPQGNVANRGRHYKILTGAAEIKAECRQVENAIKIVRTIQIAMLLSVALFVLVGELVGRIPKLNDPTPFHALSLATITIVGVIVVVRRTLVLQSDAILANRPNDAATLNRWRAGYLMTYALSEAIALFGLSLRMIGFSLSQVTSFYIAGFILLLFFSPRRPVVQTT